MPSSDGAPEIIPRVGIMVEFEQNFETSDCGFPVRHLELLVNAGGEQKCSHGIHQFAAPELVGIPGCHADHEKEGCDKTAAHQSVVCRRLIEVECAGDRHDGFEVRRLFHCGFHLRSREITDPDHADISVRPGLLRGPLDQVVHVTAFLAIEETESASGATGSPAIRNNVDVTTGHEEITGTCFYESGRSAKVLNLSWI